MVLTSLALLLLQGSDPQELTAQGLRQLRDAEQAAASGQLQGTAVVDAFLEAADTLRKASESRGAPPEAFEGWAEALLNCSDYTNAMRAVEAGLEAHPGALRLLLQEGRVHTAQAGQYQGREDRQREAWQRAAGAYGKAMELHPGSADAAVRLGEIQVYLKDVPAAQQAWREALKRDAAAVDLGNMIQWLGGDAVVLIRERLEQTGEDPTLLWYLGYAEYSAGPAAWSDCKLHFLRVLELQPQFANTWYFLAYGALAAGNSLVAAGKSEEAEVEYRFAARSWGKYLESFGAQQAQTLAGVAAEERSAFYAQIKWLMGKAYGGGDLDSAMLLAKWLTDNTPEDVEAWNNLGFFYRDAGRAEEALAAYRRAKELAPADPQVLNDLAVILHYYLKRDDEEALALYQEAIRRGEELLADTSGMSPEEVQRLQIGLRDARNNLRKLQAGDRRNF